MNPGVPLARNAHPQMAVGQKWVPEMGGPGKWNQGLKPAIPWWFNFDSYPNHGSVKCRAEGPSSSSIAGSPPARGRKKEPPSNEDPTSGEIPENLIFRDSTSCFLLGAFIFTGPTCPKTKETTISPTLKTTKSRLLSAPLLKVCFNF